MGRTIPGLEVQKIGNHWHKGPSVKGLHKELSITYSFNFLLNNHEITNVLKTHTVTLNAVQNSKYLFLEKLFFFVEEPQ